MRDSLRRLCGSYWRRKLERGKIRSHHERKLHGPIVPSPRKLREAGAATGIHFSHAHGLTAGYCSDHLLCRYSIKRSPRLEAPCGHFVTKRLSRALFRRLRSGFAKVGSRKKTKRIRSLKRLPFEGVWLHSVVQDILRQCSTLTEAPCARLYDWPPLKPRPPTTDQGVCRFSLSRCANA